MNTEMTNDELVKALLRDPLADDYRLSLHGGKRLVDTPARALGEKRAVAAIFFNHANSFPEEKELYELMARIILRAPIVFFSREAFVVFRALWGKVDDAYKTNPSMTPRPARLPAVWFCTSEWMFVTEDESGEEHHVMGTLLASGGPSGYGENYAVYVPRVGDKRKPVEVNIVGADPAFNDALYIMMEEKVARMDIVAPTRQLRKQAARLGVPYQEQINVITLRPHSSSGGPSGLRSPFEYHSRWLVSGHVRNQYYASDGTHRAKWIDPHIKGPDGAPFKESVRHVVR